MTHESKPIGERLLAVEPLSPQTRQQLEKELHAMFVQELTTVRRVFIGGIAVVSLISAVVCGSLALTEADLPTLARVGLATGTLFGLAWAVVTARICWRGTLDLKLDARRQAQMVWTFTLLMVIFFVVVGALAQDQLKGLVMIANGLVFLICAAVFWISYRIEQAELNTRERLLQLELRLAELAEKS